MSKALHFRVRPFSGVYFRGLFLTIVMMIGSLSAFSQTGGQDGFENNSVGGWTGGNASSESVSVNSTAAYNRTGSYSLALTTTSTSTNRFWYSNTPYGSSASGIYIHTIFWALAGASGTSVDASMRYTSTSPPSGAGSTSNGTATALSTSTWTRVSYKDNASSGRYYFSAPRKTSGSAGTFYMDDMLIYLSSSATTDLTDPSTPSSLAGTVTGSTVNLGWTSNTDAGTGVQATIILRTSNLSATAPDLNDQALYSTSGGASGPNTSGGWTILSTTTGATATSYADASVPTGTYLYAVILRDLAYNYSIAAVSSSVTVGASSPTITTSLTGFTSAFGNVVAGANSAVQQYSVSGAALTNNIVVTAPTGFEVSTSSSTGFGTSVTLTQSGGAVSATPIYVRYAPSAATGASGSLSITHSSTGATTQNVTVSGNALAAEPTTAGSISFSTIGTTSLVINLPTTGNGSKRIIVARQGSAVSFTPADAVASTGVNANFSLATDQGSGNKIIYDGSGSGTSLLTLSGLTSGTTYYFTVYEYNEGTGTSQNYLLSPVTSGSVSTIVPVPTITVNQTGFNGSFGNTVTGTSSPEQTYTVSAINLTASLSITAPTNFQVSLTTGTGFAGSLAISPVSGTIATTTIYVRYAPAAAAGASGSVNISNASTGAAAQTITVSGNALAAEPTTAGTIGFGTAGTTSIVTNLPTIGNGSKRIIVVKSGISPTFTPTDGSPITGVNADFSLATDQGGGNKVVYDGSGSGSSVVTATGLTPGTQYYFLVFEYNEGTGTSQNYLLSPAAGGSISTAGLTSPAIVLNQTGFTGLFGNVASGSHSSVQQYTAGGTNLTGNINITAPAGFEVSLSATSGFGSSVVLTPASGAVANTNIYVRFSPTTATGSTGSVLITNTSTGAVTQNVMVTGNALDVEPTTSGTISFGTVTSNSIVINLPAIGNGSKRIIVAHAATAVSFTPADAQAITGVSASFTAATDQGSGNKVVYDGSGSGTGVVTVTGLSQGTTYYFTVFEYNAGTGASQNYLTSPAATANIITNVPAITLNQTGFTGSFGNVVTGTTSPEQQYTVNGTNLTGNVTITAPAGFQVSLTTGTGFASSLSIVPGSSAAVSSAIYVRYAPGAATGTTGSLIISNSSTGATTQNITVSGNALAVKPTAAGTITFSAVTGTSLAVNLPTAGNGSKRIIVANAASAVSFAPTDGTAVTGVNANFTTATNQGSGNKVVYNGAGSGSSVVTVTGLTPATKYYFTVYEYNEGTGTSQNYLLSPVASDTVSTATPTITVVQTSFSGLFGNVVTGTNSAVQSYTVSGTFLIGNILVTAPAGFQVSASATTGFGTTLTLTQSGGTIASTTVYARFTPTTASGATGSLNITHTSGSAVTRNVTVSGNALAIEPTTAGTITFGTITPNAIVVNLPTTGNGTHRIIVARAGSSVSFTPTDGVAVAGVSSVFSAATDQGGGNKVIYDGNGSGTGLVTLSGLASGTTYYFAVYSYNVGTGTSQNYLATGAPTGNATTTIPPVLVNLNTSSFTGNFGDVVAGTSSAVQSYAVSGSDLTGNLSITAPLDFEISLSSSSGFSSAVTLTPSAGAVSSTIYVRYSPVAPTGATGTLNIVHSTSGTTSKNVAVFGTALAVKPSVAGTIGFGIVKPTSIEVHLPTVGNGTRRIIVANLGSPPSYIPADGPPPAGVNANYGLAAPQSGSGKIVYDGSGSGNNVVTVTGLTLGMLYYFVVYEYNYGTGTSYSYLINPAANSNMTTYLDATGIRNNQAIAARIHIYPNPVHEEINIDAPVKVSAIIIDAAGRIVYNQKDVKKINLGTFAEGMYMIRVADMTGNVLKQEKISRIR